ncbi:MAG: hypothetical protein Q8R40_06765 [bacterium]|nr:hypothetical protein [bacterium]
MKTIRAFIACLLLFVVFATTSAIAADSVVVRISRDNVVYNMNAVETKGNFSYIPLNLSGTPHENRKYILGALEAFEAQLPFTVVGGPQVDKQQRSPAAVVDWVYGIWVTHKPK